MADTVTLIKEPLGVEDVKWADGGDGAETKYLRTDNAGVAGNVQRTKIDGEHVPLRDTPVTVGGITGLRAPFAGLSSKTIEAAIIENRTHYAEYINLEHRGGFVGAAPSTDQSTNNTNILQAAINELIANGRGGGIFVPHGIYKLGTPSGYTPGAPIITASNLTGIQIVGIPGISKLMADVATVGAADNLIVLEDSANVNFVDLILDKVSANPADGACLVFQIADASQNGNNCFNVEFQAGGKGLVYTGSAATTDRRQQNFTVKDCTFGGHGGRAIFMQNFAGCKLVDCRIGGKSGVAGGIEGYAANVGESCSDFEVVGCRTTNSEQVDIKFWVATTYNSGLHGRGLIERCRTANGTISATRINQVTANRNDITSGKLSIDCDDMTDASDYRLRDNVILNSAGNGIEIIGVDTNVVGVQIEGGEIQNPNSHGILVQVTGTNTCKWFQISGVRILNPSQSGLNNADGIKFMAAAAPTSYGTINSYVQQCIIINDSALMAYALNFVNDGNNNNIFNRNNILDAGQTGTYGGQATAADWTNADEVI